MKLLNTIPLPNSLIAHSINAVAVYVDGVVKIYTKNGSNGLDLQATSYTIDGVRELHMSENGDYVAAQTDTQIIRCAKGIQTAFTATGRFAISNTGMIIHLSYTTGAVQLITDSTTNITVTLSSNDRVVCGRTKYIVYSATRYLTAAYSDVTYVTTTPSVSILQIFHCGNDKFAIFFSDGTATFIGTTRTPAATLPRMGFRKFGKALAFTDYKNEYINTLDGPISDGIFLRKFVRDLPPVADPAQWAKYLMLIVGNTAVASAIDAKNGLAATNIANVSVVNDSPYGTAGTSLSFNGTTSILQTADSANIQLGSADFTLELFVLIAGGATNVVVLVNKGNDVTTTFASYILSVNLTTKKFSFAASTSGSSYEVSISFGALELNVWTHIAVSRQGNNWRCFQDGILSGTATVSGTLVAVSGRGLLIGHSRSGDYNTGTIVSQLNGKIHALSLLKYAKYTANFFVETLPLTVAATRPTDFTPYVWTQMTFASGQAIEEVSRAPLLVTNGSVTNKKFVNTDTASNSLDRIPPIYFDAGEDFSIEGWINFSSLDAYGASVISQDSTTNASDRSYIFTILNSNRVPYAALTDVGTDATLTALSSPDALVANTDYHIALCRVNNVVTLYINGVAKASANYAKATFKNTMYQMFRRGAIASRWNIRVMRGLSAYIGNFTPPATLPALTKITYDAAVLGDIVFQACMKNNALINEKTGEAITLNSATVEYGRLVTTAVKTSFFSANCAYFGAADFTIECNVRLTARANYANAIMGQYIDAPQAGNGWLIYIESTGVLTFYMPNTSNGSGSGTALAATTVPLNTDVHIVIERVGSKVTVYFNGVAVGNVTFAQALFPSTKPIRNIWDTSGSNGSAQQVTNIRIAKRAMYNGVIKRPASFPDIVLSPAASPGPQTLAKGTKQLGYYGQVSNADMQNGEDLSALVGLSAGVAMNASTVWLKFAYQNKIIFVPKMPQRRDIPWSAIYNAGAVYGTDDIGYAPISPNVNQKKVITLNASKYVVRLPQGADAEVSTSTAYFTQNPTGVQNSEWNALMGRVWESDPTATYWEKFTAAEMGALIGSASCGVWSQESVTQQPTYRVLRNHPPLLGYTADVTTAQNANNLIDSWWPFLEWQNPKVPNFNLIDGTTLPTGTTNTNVTVSSNKVTTVGTGSFLSIPNDSTLALGTADFEITFEFTINSIVTNANGNVSAFLFWANYAQASQIYNLDIYYYHTGGYFVFGGNTAFDSNMEKHFNYTLTTGKAYKVSFVRESGVLYLYINGRQVSSVPYAYDLAYKGAVPILVGRRRGGASGEINWDSNMEIRSLVIRK